jgi:hypothetical protein
MFSISWYSPVLPSSGLVYFRHFKEADGLRKLPSTKAAVGTAAIAVGIENRKYPVSQFTAAFWTPGILAGVKKPHPLLKFFTTLFAFIFVYRHIFPPQPLQTPNQINKRLIAAVNAPAFSR